ncbi:AraC family transcriptional regulator [Pseudomaricurvus alkylphenolicus]|uniref:helix-turn-helix transcriptional regulator n=1 Tax=Pseudomaricurvus alkylphenolicus TaxID=1306991 RepID=UPI0014203EB0|nr:AraC family transcriptional regulator [Pseudomaricurvus alkylphenolicus]NIB41774.1 AraC family transcriptional regulator [Pseudomaricurvus alkylphenolicus]
MAVAMTHFVPVKHLYKLADLIDQEHGLDAITFWQDHDVNLPKDPSEFIAEEDFKSACKLAVHYASDPVLGLKFGRNVTLTNMGPLGAAMMSCDTLAESLELAICYRNGFFPNEFHTWEEGDSVHICPAVSEAHAAFSQFDLQVFSMVLVQSIMDLLHIGADGITVHFHFSIPDCSLLRSYQEYLSADIAFDQKHSKLIIPKSLMQTKLQSRDEISKTSFIRACQSIQDSLFTREALTNRIFSLLDEVDSYPSLDEMATILIFSPRKLRYQLSKEGTTYREVLSRHRLRKAMDLLGHSDTPIKSISELAGYQDLSSFYRSFKKEMGVTPAQWRHDNS